MSGNVVADAGPLHYLILIDSASILERLFDQVFISKAVQGELLRDSTPQKVRVWMSQRKSWMEIRSVKDAGQIPGLHRGEAEAIQLALETHAAAVLMDDLDGRKEARLRGLNVIGSVGLLERAAEKELIVLSDAIAKLRQTNFFVSPELLDAALERDHLRRTK
jgi:hypothetical protein